MKSGHFFLIFRQNKPDFFFLDCSILTLQIKVQRGNAPCVIIWSQLSLAPWNIVSAACAAPLDWSQDVLFCPLLAPFLIFFRQRQTTSRLVSRDRGLCAGYVAAAAARPRSPLHISQLSEIIRLSPSRWTFFTHTHSAKAGCSERERKSRLTLIAALWVHSVCVRPECSFFCAVSTLFASGLASRSAFIKRGMCAVPTGSIQISWLGERWCFWHLAARVEIGRYERVALPLDISFLWVSLSSNVRGFL